VDLRAALGRERVRAIVCGAYSTFALTSRGGVIGWGLNNSGQLSLDVASDADLIAWRPVRLARLEGVATLAGGAQQTLALTKDGRLLAFGASVYGQLGRGGVDVGSANAKHPEPGAVEVGALDGAAPVALAAGEHVSACTTADGNAFFWGMASTGAGPARCAGAGVGLPSWACGIGGGGRRPSPACPPRLALNAHTLRPHAPLPARRAQACCPRGRRRRATTTPTIWCPAR
jgi:hypothetical protein